MSDFNQDMQNLLNAYDSNWEDYLILREQFIEKYSLSVEKLQERCDRYEKALTEITNIPESDNYFDCEECIVMMEEAAKQALAAIGGDDE